MKTLDPYPHQRLRLKTYSHLAAQKRMPTEYEIVTSKLLYYLPRGFEVKTPISSWYEKYQSGSPLQCDDWEKFKDPRETTYTKYTALQRDKEIFIEGILKGIEATGYDHGLNDAWVRTLYRTLSPLRFVYHGFQMISAYIGSMAPSGRIAIALALQSADEMRKIQLIAYRMRQLQERFPGLGDDGRDIWMRDPRWQPLREAVERLLVTYDWGEAFVALNLCLKPVVDEIFLVNFPRIAKENGDSRLEELFFSLNEDSAWQKDWSRELVRVAITERPLNRELIQEWTKRWTGPAMNVAQVLEGECHGAKADLIKVVENA